MLHETYRADTAIDNGWDNSDNWGDFNYGVDSDCEISNAEGDWGDISVLTTGQNIEWILMEIFVSLTGCELNAVVELVQ